MTIFPLCLSPDFYKTYNQSFAMESLPSLNGNGHRWLYGIPKGGMEYCPLPTTSSSSSSSSMALSWTNASFLHLLRCQDFLHVFTSRKPVFSLLSIFMQFMQQESSHVSLCPSFSLILFLVFFLLLVDGSPLGNTWCW